MLRTLSEWKFRQQCRNVDSARLDDLPTSKNGGPGGGPPSGSRQPSESETSLELDESRGSIASQERTQDAGWSVDRANDRAEVRVGDIAYGLVEVGVVE